MRAPHAPVSARDADDDAACHLVDTTMFWSLTGGGVQRYLKTKHGWLARTPGWRHTIFAPGARGWGFEDAGGIPLPGSGGYRLPWDRHAAARRIEGLGPDLIEAGDPLRLGWASLDAGQRLGVPVLAFCHSNVMEMAARLVGGPAWCRAAVRRTVGAYVARMYRDFDLVLAPSRSMVEQLRALGLDNVEQQALGVDSKLFHPSRRDPAVRTELGVSPETRLLLFAGRFAPEKNLPLLAEAVRRLGKPYLLLAVGDGPLPPHGPRVRCLPYEPRPAQLARLMASADAFVHAGDQESFGLAPLEAMACGTPVVVRQAAGLAELAEGGAGLAVDSDKPSEWTEAIAALFAVDQEPWRRAGRACAERHDWGQVLTQLANRYRRLIHGSRLTGEEATLPALHWCGIPTSRRDGF
ncbi:glycosyltransferase family 4 protein [Azohydromonas caseinilytica]|uniref:Glycosyltransferase family 1 protein n=1 Tax=Azohydromonas caseinilytica TaxID=2728836 RepID=A0A848F5F5_9BURK|nr:glycosyltransferase family 1 protein [Azohydromonas caseinilytica]NML13530.1 glycosyltransferase family 1 protein [Azohydromonas caseinilytica]